MNFTSLPLVLLALPGYLLSQDFFHAYNRVSMDWVDKVLKVMGFGLIFRNWNGITLQGGLVLFPPLQHLFGPRHPLPIRQGDPLAALLFIIYL
jgi:hypothetical protein